MRTAAACCTWSWFGNPAHARYFSTDGFTHSMQVAAFSRQSPAKFSLEAAKSAPNWQKVAMGRQCGKQTPCMWKMSSPMKAFSSSDAQEEQDWVRRKRLWMHFLHLLEVDAIVVCHVQGARARHGGHVKDHLRTRPQTGTGPPVQGQSRGRARARRRYTRPWAVRVANLVEVHLEVFKAGGLLEPHVQLRMMRKADRHGVRRGAVVSITGDGGVADAVGDALALGDRP
eukprot:UN3585